MSQFTTAQPYIASYVILRRDGKIPFVLRSHTGWMDGRYGLASGKVEEGETYVQAAVRETKEEIGVIILPENVKHLLTCHRREPGEAISWVDLVYEATEWRGEPVNAEPHKHGELAWLDPANLPENIVPSVKFMLDQIKVGQTYCEYGWR
jgi:ADP-ribose pyrophosphatase YjhB (NUDIX family)